MSNSVLSAEEDRGGVSSRVKDDPRSPNNVSSTRNILNRAFFFFLDRRGVLDFRQGAGVKLWIYAATADQGSSWEVRIWKELPAEYEEWDINNGLGASSSVL